MKIFKTLTELQEFWPENVPSDASFGLAFLRGGFGAHDLAAVQEAVRVCDVGVVACLDGESNGAVKPEFLERSWVKAFYNGGFDGNDGADVKVNVPVLEGEGANILKVILAVMPSMVVVSAANPALLVALIALEKAFVNLFVLRVWETPDKTLEPVQQKWRKEIKLAAKKCGRVGTVDNLRAYGKEYLAKQEVKLKSLSVVSADGKVLGGGSALGKGAKYIAFAVDDDGVIWEDGVVD